jgi:acyl-CoA synthetase (AMP-forming)/AMP-acid ligase II
MATVQDASGPEQRLSIIRGPTIPTLLNWTFNDLLRERCKQNPTSVAISSQHQNESITYSELEARSKALAAGLYSLGVRRGDRVAVLLGNRLEYAIVSRCHHSSELSKC